MNVKKIGTWWFNTVHNYSQICFGLGFEMRFSHVSRWHICHRVAHFYSVHVCNLCCTLSIQIKKDKMSSHLNFVSCINAQKIINI